MKDGFQEAMICLLKFDPQVSYTQMNFGPAS